MLPPAASIFSLADFEKACALTVTARPISPSPRILTKSAFLRTRPTARSTSGVLAAALDDKAVLVANLHPEVSEKIRAGDIVREVSDVPGGGGGGGPTMAQAGGGNTEAIPEALTRAREILSRRLANDVE